MVKQQILRIKKTMDNTHKKRIKMADKKNFIDFQPTNKIKYMKRVLVIEMVMLVISRCKAIKNRSVEIKNKA